MICIDELRSFPIFECLSDQWLQRIAGTAAEVSVTSGDWIIREGETPSFFVLLDGALVCEKDYGGPVKFTARYAPGDFYGEIPILLDSVAIASLRATQPSRLLRLDRLQFKDMIASSPRCNRLVTDVMKRRLTKISGHLKSNEMPRVQVFGSRESTECRDIRSFLTQNHITYRWNDDHIAEPFALVDQAEVLTRPLSVRRMAEALGMRTSPSRHSYDLTIVGGGPAGLAAAVSAASEGLSTLVIEKYGIGGQAACSSRIENYPGFPTGISGNELGAKAMRQAEHFGAEILITREVRSIDPMYSGFCVNMDDLKVETETVLVASGVRWRTLDAEGADRLLGKGILYGAARMEAQSVVGKDVFIVGSGNSAGQAAVFLSDYASSVTLLVRGERIRSSMSQYLAEQIERRPNVSIETGTTVVAVEGMPQLEAICTETSDGRHIRKADALFVMIGAIADSPFLPADLERDQHGFIVTGSELRHPAASRNAFALETSLPGMFCAGDIRHGSIKRVASGMGEGSMAVAYIHRYLALRAQARRAIA